MGLGDESDVERRLGMNQSSARRVMMVIIPLNCVYVVAIVLFALRSTEDLRRIPLYMICVLAVNWIVWLQWGPRFEMAGWKRKMRFCAWVILLVNVPALGLALVDRPTESLIASLILSLGFGAGGLWLANPGRAAG